MRAKRSKKNTILTILLFVFLAVFIFAAIMLVHDLLEYKKIDSYYSDLQIYKPEILTKTDSQTPSDDDNDTSSEPVINQALIDLMNQYPDVTGWLTVEGADISYPVVQSGDNSQYLKTDLDGSYLSGGTLFMDYRCARDYSAPVTLIYGHNMKNGSMFGNIDDNYGTQGYLEQNPDVYISLGEENIHYTAIAYMLVDADDQIIYDLTASTEEFANYVRNNSLYLNSNRSFTGDDSFLVLSTCAYNYEDARALLICVREPEM